MGLDATMIRINMKLNSDLEYEEIRKQKWLELNKKDYERWTDVEDIFDEWEETMGEEILYTSDWDVANIINSINVGERYVDFNKGRNLILTKEDIEIILDEMRKDEIYKNYVEKLEYCLETTDFNNQTIMYGEWF